MSVFGWIIFHQRIGYAFDWNLPWADYKAGFGSIDADFWLGLEKIHLLTSSQPYRLMVEVQERSTNLWYSAEYWSFKIGDELNDKSIDWKCPGTAETPATRFSTKAAGMAMPVLAATITTA